MILSVKAQHINAKDELLITVDSRSNLVIRKESRKLNDNETLWVKFYVDGFVSFGLTMEKDPQHDNEKYTWSSRPEVINDVFQLDDTWKLATYTVGVKELDGQFSCYFSMGIRLAYALKLAEANQDRLKYGYIAFYINNTGEAFIEVEPAEGIYIYNKLLVLEPTEDCKYPRTFIRAREGYVDLHKLSDYVLNRTGIWCLKDVMNTIINTNKQTK